mgnify:FL=1
MLKPFLRKLKIGNVISYLKHHYPLIAKYHTYLELNRNIKDRCILVYTMGKVGSSTIVKSLDNQLHEYFVFHIHWLAVKNLTQDQNFYKTFYQRNRKQGVYHKILPAYLIEGRYINERINRSCNYKNIEKIFTLTREPLARNISSFFENLKIFFGYDIDKNLRIKDEDTVVDELITLFCDEFIINNTVNFLDADPLTWFDIELKEVFNLDVFNSEFPKEKGYKIYSNEVASVLLIRLEDLNECFSEASEIFLEKNCHF